MALINCPECQKEISSSAKACPNCGFPVSSTSEVAATIYEELTIEQQPQKVEVTSIKLVSKKNKKRIGIAIGIIILLAIAGIIICFSIAKRNEEIGRREAEKYRQEYIEKLKNVNFLMLSGAAESEKLCNLTYQVWSNTIYKKFDGKTDKYTVKGIKFNEDFNTSLANLYNDEDTKKSITKIKENQKDVGEIIPEIKNPPEDLKDCSEIVNKMYDSYISLTNFANSPSGSLKSYNENFNNYDRTFMDLYNKLKLLMPKE